MTILYTKLNISRCTLYYVCIYVITYDIYGTSSVVLFCLHTTKALCTTIALSSDPRRFPRAKYKSRPIHVYLHDLVITYVKYVCIHVEI